MERTDADVLLDGILPDDEVVDDDEVIWQPEPETPEGGLGDDSQRPAPRAEIDPSKYVERSVVDTLSAQLQVLTEQNRALSEQVGRLAAGGQQQQFNPQQSEIDRLNQDFLMKPAEMVTRAIAAGQQQQGAGTQAQLDAYAAMMARSRIDQLKAQYAADNPEVAKIALAKLDEVVAKTTPAKLAELVRAGTLDSEVERAYYEQAGRVVLPVYKSAAQRRAGARTQSEPVSIGGSSVSRPGGPVTPITKNQPVKMSDLTEDEKDVYRWLQTSEGKRSGLTIQDVIAQRETA